MNRTRENIIEVLNLLMRYNQGCTLCEYNCLGPRLVPKVLEFLKREDRFFQKEVDYSDFPLAGYAFMDIEDGFQSREYVEKLWENDEHISGLPLLVDYFSSDMATQEEFEYFFYRELGLGSDGSFPEKSEYEILDEYFQRIVSIIKAISDSELVTAYAEIGVHIPNLDFPIVHTETWKGSFNC